MLLKIYSRLCKGFIDSINSTIFQKYEKKQWIPEKKDIEIIVDRIALTRSRATALQSGLSANQRAHNVRQAFSYSPRRDYRHVAIVDDIVTTGSTVDEITRVLHREGVEFVEVWALARVYHR